MHKVFLDVNVILDIAFEQGEFRYASENIVSMAEFRKIMGFMSAVSFPVIFYVLRKYMDSTKVLDLLKRVTAFIHIVKVDEPIIQEALNGPGRDFEDNIQMACANSVRADYLITRNIKDYLHSFVPAVTPDQYLALI